MVKKLLILAVAAGIGLYFFGPKLFPKQFAMIQCRSKQSEAKVNLKRAREAVTRNISTLGKMPVSLDAMGWNPVGVRVRYEYSYIPRAADEFEIEATAPLGTPMYPDTWVIQEGGSARNTRDFCKDGLDA